MHPIERLRYVARASGAEPHALTQEIAGSLARFAGDPPALVTACRRMVDRHPAIGPIWWLCARVLTAGDPADEAWRALDDLHADRTVAELAHALPQDATVCVLGWPERLGEALSRRGDVDVLVVDTLDEGSGFARHLVTRDVGSVDVPLSGLAAAASEADVILLDVLAGGPDELLAVAGSHAAAAVARSAGKPVWAVVGVGRLLPTRMWDALVDRVTRPAEPWDLDEERVPVALVDRVVGVRGLESVEDAMRRIDCPVAPELLRSV